METTECRHIEHVTTMHGMEVGTCSLCGQIVKYEGGNKVTITKLGRIGEAMVMPPAGIRLSLMEADRADLDKALASPKPIEPPAKPSKVKLTSKQRLQFYKENKKAMIEDLIALGNEDFLAKWPVSRQTISHLRSDKLYKKLTGGVEEASAPLKERGAKVVRSGKDLPPLPGWSDTWPAEVQVKWLEIWRELHGLKGD